MALNRYDLRKNCEQTETLAIGTAYSRADLLAPSDGSKMQTLLKTYLDQRVRYFSTRSESRVVEISSETERLQKELWTTLQAAIPAVPPPLMGLLVTALNDVVNSERSTQAAWRNRIPLAAWILIIGIGIGCAGLIGYRARGTDWLAFLMVPVAVSICFFLMADLDSPLGGVIRVTPANLSSLSDLLAR